MLGIPKMALSAYRNAEQIMAASDPGCGVSWNLLAGIGRIESMHANGGATDARGTAISPIYGPALDGTLPGNAIVVQSSIAGRVTYARAMGPMQFLPGTWAHYASDGDGDGVADPRTCTTRRWRPPDTCAAGAQSAGFVAGDRCDPALQQLDAVCPQRTGLGSGIRHRRGSGGPATADRPATAAWRHTSGEPGGLGPGLPLNIHGLPSTDPLAQMPLIDLGQSTMPTQQPMWPWQSSAPARRPAPSSASARTRPSSRPGRCRQGRPRRRPT
ncbi:transglycosylase SLT domain protein [Mycobacterium xenopi 4042]|uniref:Transglycosylase SLT domain protein n=1 Tax=Mycobacterium xenopi 4042 TaxID=1299334 RepID=X8E0A1_MYCXE|nr:transglycosylase SLT domain protein [Mycobacterium xenopi 4042]